MDVYDHDGMEYMCMPDSEVPSHAFRNPSGQALVKVRSYRVVQNFAGLLFSGHIYKDVLNYQLA